MVLHKEFYNTSHLVQFDGLTFIPSNEFEIWSLTKTVPSGNPLTRALSKDSKTVSTFKLFNVLITIEKVIND